MAEHETESQTEHSIDDRSRWVTRSKARLHCRSLCARLNKQDRRKHYWHAYQYCCVDYRFFSFFIILGITTKYSFTDSHCWAITDRGKNQKKGVVHPDLSKRSKQHDWKVKQDPAEAMSWPAVTQFGQNDPRSILSPLSIWIWWVTRRLLPHEYS